MVKDLVNKLSVDEENHEYLIKNYQEGGRFRLFSNVFFGKMGAMSRTNWIMLLFCLPLFAALFYTAYLAYDYASYSPFSSNFGLGYPVVPDAEQIYAELIYKNNMFRALLFIPGIIVAFIGLAGMFNVIKYESLGISVKVWKTFFKGIKNNIATFLWLGLINGLMVFLLIFSVNFYGNPDLGLAWKIITITLTVLAMIFVLIMSFYIMTQSALYNLSLGRMIKNAFWLTVSFVLQNFIILILSLLPIGLIFLMSLSVFLQILIIMILAMMGFSYIVCVWTVYGHYVYGMVFTAVIEKDKPTKKNKRKRAENK